MSKQFPDSEAFQEPWLAYSLSGNARFTNRGFARSLVVTRSLAIRAVVATVRSMDLQHTGNRSAKHLSDSQNHGRRPGHRLIGRNHPAIRESWAAPVRA